MVVLDHMGLDFRVEHLSSHARAGSQPGGLGASVRLGGRLFFMPQNSAPPMQPIFTVEAWSAWSMTDCVSQ